MNGGGMNRGNNTPSSPSWMLGAPVTKAFTMAMVGSYIITEMLDWHPSMHLDLDRLSNDGEIWRLTTSQLVFSTIAELIFGLGILTPLMRRFEREMGHRKYGTFLFFTAILSTTWNIVLAQIFHDIHRASGPYDLIGVHLFLFHHYTPRLYPRFFGILGFDFSEKSLTYVFAAQLLFSGGLTTVIPATCGFLAGFLCIHPGLPVSKWELPEFFYRLCGMVGSGFMETATTPRIIRRRRATEGGGGAGGGMQRLIGPDRRGGGGPNIRPAMAPFAPVEVPPPPEEMVGNLVSMGFDREAVIRALRQSGNNVEVAANRLLSE